MTEIERDPWDMSIAQALHWSFGIEFANLDLVSPSARDEISYGVGVEWVILQQGLLGGVQIDKSRKIKDHVSEDAETIAGIVAALPRSLGGPQMAVQVTQLAVSDRRPDVMAGEVPRIFPREWTAPNQRSGRMGKTEILRTYVERFYVPHPRQRKAKIERKRKIVEAWVPCIWDPHPDEIAAVRDNYRRWYRALVHIRSECLRSNLRKVRLNEKMPPAKPWETRNAV